MNVHKKIFILFVSMMIMFSLVLFMINKKQRSPISDTSTGFTQDTERETCSPNFLPVKQYQVKEFDIVMGAKKFSAKQISDHKQLYAGYVNKRNEVDQVLQEVDKSKANQSYSSFRGLKVAETFVRNGSLLHELYFENIGTGTSIGPKTEAIIIKNFGSVAAFKEDLMATATSARAWVLTCYNLDDQRVQNYLLDTHNTMVPILTIPLLVVDTYEHAYMIDFGINRKEYLDVLWDNINWDVVEKRVEKWALL